MITTTLSSNYEAHLNFVNISNQTYIQFECILDVERFKENI